MKHMNRILFLSLVSFSFYGCNSYKNKDIYEITVGETVEIYYTTNSCCYYCVANEKTLEHVKIVQKKVVDNAPEDCAGCDYTVALIFEGKSVGIDTVELKLITGSNDCDSTDVKPEKYIIKVK